MSHSFGEGYATRSDEEGFGGIYGGNQSMPKTETDKFIHENHPGLISLSHKHTTQTYTYTYIYTYIIYM